MHRSVIDVWPAHSQKFEGRVPGMYCDILGLITCAQGNLIDPIMLAERLPWTLEDGSKADLAQVRADWHLLKANADFYSKRHWRYALNATKCRLTDAAMDAIVAQKRDDFERYLKQHHFPEWETYPADAQLGIMSMAWACGPGFPTKFANFKRAVINGDWSGAAASCKIREEGNPGVVPRNTANRLCFANAALVVKLGLDIGELFWPTAPPSIGVASLADEQAKDLHRAAVLAQSLAGDVVGTPGANLRNYDAAEHDAEPPPGSVS